MLLQIHAGATLLDVLKVDNYCMAVRLGFIGVRLTQASPDQVHIYEIECQKHKITKRTHLLK